MHAFITLSSLDDGFSEPNIHSKHLKLAAQGKFKFFSGKPPSHSAILVMSYSLVSTTSFLCINAGIFPEVQWLSDRLLCVG